MWCVDCGKDCGDIVSHKCACGHYKSKHAKDKPSPAVKDDLPDWKQQRKIPSSHVRSSVKEVQHVGDSKVDVVKKESAAPKSPKAEPLETDRSPTMAGEEKPRKSFFGGFFTAEKQTPAKAFPEKNPLESDFGESVRSGWLLKLSHGRISKFQRRYCLLRDGNLLYFNAKPKTENDVARKYIQLEGYVPMVEEDPELLKKLRLKSQCVLFKLIHPVKPHYAFATESEEILIEWVKALATEMYREFAVVHDAPVDANFLQKRYQRMESVAAIQPEDTTWERDMGLEKELLEKKKAKKAALQAKTQAQAKSNSERIDLLASKKESLKKQVEAAVGIERKKLQTDLDAVRSELASAVESNVMLSSTFHQDLEDLETPISAKPPEPRPSVTPPSQPVPRSSLISPVVKPEIRPSLAPSEPRRVSLEQHKPVTANSIKSESPRGSATSSAETIPKLSSIQQRKLDLEKRDLDARAQASVSFRATTATRTTEPARVSTAAQSSVAVKNQLAESTLIAKKADASAVNPASPVAMGAEVSDEAAALAKLEAARVARAAAVERMQNLAQDRARKEAERGDTAMTTEAHQEAQSKNEQERNEAKKAKIEEDAKREKREREEIESEREKTRQKEQNTKEAQEKLRKTEDQKRAEELQKAEAAKRQTERQNAEATKREQEMQQKAKEKEELQKAETAKREKEELQKAETTKREKEELQKAEVVKREKEELQKAEVAKREKEELQKAEAVKKEELRKAEAAKKEEQQKAEAAKKEKEKKSAAEKEEISRKAEEKHKHDQDVANAKKKEKKEDVPRNSMVSSIPANSKVGKLPIHQYEPLAPGTKLTGMPAMLHWTQKATRGFPGVKIVNFTKSWQDGLAFAALCANWRPDLMDYWSLDPSDALGNLQKAWVAAEKMGVSMLLDAEDVVDYQDNKSIMTQMTMFHRALNHLDPAPRPWEGGGNSAVEESRVVPKEVKNLVTLVQSFERRYNELNVKQVEAGEGEALFDSLKQTLPKIQQWKTEFPDELSATIQLYNRLNKELPAKVNEFLVEISAKRKPGGSTSTCAACMKPLSGKTVEAVNMFFHVPCFKCEACGKALTKTCINIKDKPFCDACGRNAVDSTR